MSIFKSVNTLDRPAPVHLLSPTKRSNGNRKCDETINGCPFLTYFQWQAGLWFVKRRRYSIQRLHLIQYFSLKLNQHDEDMSSFPSPNIIWLFYQWRLRSTWFRSALLFGGTSTKTFRDTSRTELVRDNRRGPEVVHALRQGNLIHADSTQNWETISRTPTLSKQVNSWKYQYEKQQAY